MRARTRSLGVAVALTAALALTGCSAVDGIFGADEPERDDSGEIVEGSDADVFSLRVGDCLDAEESVGEVESVPTVPCSEPHADEAYATMDLPAGDFPGDEAIGESALEFCGEEFPTFVGIAYDDSALDYWPMTPTEAGWDTVDDRQIMCFVYDPEGPTTGTLKDAQR